MRTALALVAALAVAPFLLSDFHVFQLTQVLIYAIALLGLNLVTGVNGQISLGHGAFMAVGAYVAATLLGLGLPYWAAVPAAGAVAFGAGFLLGLPARRLEGIYLALATFGLAVTTPALLKLDALARWTGGVQGMSVDKPEPQLGLDADRWLYAVVLAITIALAACAWNLVRGRTGRALVATRDHPIAAATMGIDTARVKTMVFAVSALYTGVAGALAALATGFIAPDSFTMVLSTQLLVGVVVGGVGSILGMLAGAVFIELIPGVAEKVSDAAPAAVYGIVLIGVMMVMPGGLAGFIRAVRARSGGSHVD